MNNTLSKEEILNKYDLIFYEASADIVEGELEKVAKSMDEYAKQECIEFDGWKREEKIYHGLFDKDNGMWYYSTGELVANNTAELYDIYVKSRIS